ncbi:MAG TPA: class I SAM-dependent methyltransferase [Candidatus Pacearchaeota archaeon]|nr:class I SAM-dependent methyltransferase [Candidatus Pacearchaeota archaeon]HPR79715.1 class I SAM-dependent methyltransferase [Candidatus Pacearchaeota archaeon]
MNEGFLNPQQIIKNISLREDMVACDFGCGSGGWVIPLAKELKSGMVYAVDILDTAISALNGKISSEKIFNIKPVIGDIEKGIKMPDEYFDLILMTNLLFQIGDKEKVLEEGKRLLKNNGMILIVDWEKDAPIGSKEGRVSIEEIKELAREVGLSSEKEFKAGSFHWGLILRKI